MAKKDVAVLDFGSGKLTLLVGSRSVNGNFSITASSDIDYAGFMEGEFIEEDELATSIKQSIDEVNQILSRPITKLFVGVPAEFCEFTNKTITKNYGKRVKLTPKMIDSLFVDADSYVISNTHSVINVSPLYYVLDETNETTAPDECYCKTISVEACFISADDRFISLIGEILKNLKIKEVEYVSSILAEGQYLFEDSKRDKGVLLVDCGFLSTTVAHLKGDGITELRNIPTGGAQITAGICENLGLSFPLAEQAKRQIILSLKPTGVDSFDIVKNGKIEQVPANKVMDSAIRVIDEIINEVKYALDNFDNDVDDMELYLTGGGLAYLKAIEYYMGGMLERRVKVIMPRPLKLNKPDLSSVIGLLDASIKMEQ